MNRVTRSEGTVWSIDDLEIELRMLPGVRAAGFEESDDMLFVQLHVADEPATDQRDRADTPVSASRIAARHSDRPVTVEVVRWRGPLPAPGAPAPPEVEAPAAVAELAEPPAPDVTAADAPAPGVPPRARLLAVLAFPDSDELEVHLVLEGRRTIGRATASEGIAGAARATLDAVHDLGTGVRARLLWAREIDDASGADRVLVAVALDGVDARAAVNYGVAGGASQIDAAARATLDALDRRMSLPR